MFSFIRFELLTDVSKIVFQDFEANYITFFSSSFAYHVKLHFLPYRYAMKLVSANYR